MCKKYFAPKDTNQLRRHVNDIKEQNHEQWRKTHPPQSSRRAQSPTVTTPLEKTYQRLQDVLSVETINSCRSVPLDELTSAPYDGRALWEATTTYPALYSAEDQPFDKSFPDEKKIFVSCMAAETRHVRVFVHGMDGYRQQENDQRKALAEMAWDFRQEAHQNRALSAAFEISDYTLDPPALSCGLSMLEKGETDVFWSFKGSFTDLHVGKYQRVRVTFECVGYIY